VTKAGSGAKTDLEGFDIGPLVTVPANVCSLESQAHLLDTEIPPTQGTLLVVGGQYPLTELSVSDGNLYVPKDALRGQFT